MSRRQNEVKNRDINRISTRHLMNVIFWVGINKTTIYCVKTLRYILLIRRTCLSSSRISIILYSRNLWSRWLSLDVYSTKNNLFLLHYFCTIPFILIYIFILIVTNLYFFKFRKQIIEPFHYSIKK
jgi:hypothetical protein